MQLENHSQLCKVDIAMWASRTHANQIVQHAADASVYQTTFTMADRSTQEVSVQFRLAHRFASSSQRPLSS